MASFHVPASGPPSIPASAVRRRRWSVWGRVGLLATFAVVALGTSVPMWVHEQALDRRGVQAEAEVVETSYERRLPDTALVIFKVGDERYYANLTVSRAGDFEGGQTIAIEYDPDDPVHARPLEGWSPTYRTLWWYAAVGLPGAFVLAYATKVGPTGWGRGFAASTSSGCGPRGATARLLPRCRCRPRRPWVCRAR